MDILEVYGVGWFLTIGKQAPWQNFSIRLPKVLAVWINKKLNKRREVIWKKYSIC